MGNGFEIVPPEKGFETVPSEKKPLMAHPTGGPPKLPDISPFLQEGTAQIGAFGKGAFEGLKSTLLNPPAYGGALKLPFAQPQEQLPIVGGKIQFPQDVMPDTGQPPENWQASLVNQLRQLPFVEATEKLIHPTEPYQRAETSGELIGGVAPFLLGAGKGTYRPEEGYKGFLKAFTRTRPDFKEHVNRLTERGHLTELSRDVPKDFIDANKKLRTYMDDWESSTIDPAIARHSGETIDGTNIAQDLSKLKNAQLDVFFPGSDDYIALEQGKYVGKQIPLGTARELLARLNAFTKDLEDMSPEDAAAAQRKSIAKAALDTTATSVRSELYSKLSHLGEKGIAEAQKDYGAMKELKENIYKNIPHAEKAEASKPGYDLGIFSRAIQRHPLLTGGMLLGAGYEHNPAMMLALPAIEALTTVKERASTPNALLKKAVKSYKGGPEVVRPKFEPPAQKLTAPEPPIEKPSLPTVPPPTVLRLSPTGEAIPSVEPFERTNVPKSEVISKPTQEIPNVPELSGPQLYDKVSQMMFKKNYWDLNEKEALDADVAIESAKKGEIPGVKRIDISEGLPNVPEVPQQGQLPPTIPTKKVEPFAEQTPQEKVAPEQLHKEAMKAVEEEQSKPKGIPVPDEVEEARRKIKETEEKARNYRVTNARQEKENIQNMLKEGRPLTDSIKKRLSYLNKILKET